MRCSNTTIDTKIYTRNELRSREAGSTAVSPMSSPILHHAPKIKPFAHPGVYKNNHFNRPEVNNYAIGPSQTRSTHCVALLLCLPYHCGPSPPPTPKTAPCGMDPWPLGTTRPLGARSLGDEIIPPYCLGGLPSGRSPFV
jgi:hypothetical protein